MLNYNPKSNQLTNHILGGSVIMKKVSIILIINGSLILSFNLLFDKKNELVDYHDYNKNQSSDNLNC